MTRTDPLGTLARWDRTLAEIEADGPAVFRAVRRELGLSQKQLASRLGSPRAHVAWLERGEVRVGSGLVRRLVALARECVTEPAR